MVEARGVLAAHRAIWIAGDTGALPGHGEGIEPQETAFERLSDAGQELPDLHCLDTADDPDERRRDAGVGAALGKVGDLGIETAIAGTPTGAEDHDLAFEANGGPRRQYLFASERVG